jgi:hypothetical protein
MKDLIISASTKYTKIELNNYIKSINECGFSGDKIMLVYDLTRDTIDWLKENGWDVFQGELSGHIHMNRLISIYAILKQLNKSYRYIITTDVRDVVFQKNPSIYLEENLKKDILVSSENVTYENESWGTKNILEGYGTFYFDIFKEKLTCNVGVLAGKFEAIKDLLLLNYLVSQSGDTQHFTDQSSFNFIINNYLIKDKIQVEGLETNWALQLGTLNNPKLIGEFGKFNLDEYFIIHQYDRDSQIKELIYQKYK